MRLSKRIIGCAIDVHRELGPGFLESVYERALSIRLEKAGIKHRTQTPIEVWFDNEVVGQFQADMIVEDKLLIELKGVRNIVPRHEAQLLHYLKATGLTLGLLLNFGSPILQVKRMINGELRPEIDL